MARPKSIKREAVSTKINAEIVASLRAYSEKSGININRIIEKALEEYLKSQLPPLNS